MTTFDLLSAVHPSTGRIAVFGLHSWKPEGQKQIRQELVATTEEAYQIRDAWLAQKFDVYFGVAKFGEVPVMTKKGKPGKGRTKEDVVALRSVWLDLDCGPGKPYANTKAAMQALGAFVNATGLPLPIIVNSGNGAHVYWAFDRNVTRAEWEPVVAALHERCMEHGLVVDPACLEAARVLRMPGTMNFKDPADPKPVEVVVEAPPTTWEVVCDAVGMIGSTTSAPAAPQRGQTALGKALAEADPHIPKNFTRIVTATDSSTGCKQLQSCIKDRVTLPEPLWRAALSVAKVCTDKEEAIKAVSEDYDGYKYADALAKANLTPAPHTCAEFEKLNPGGCNGCSHFGKVKSPAVLGIEDANAGASTTYTYYGADGAARTYVRPACPFPYYIGANGGIWKKTPNPEMPDESVCDDDIFADGSTCNTEQKGFEYRIIRHSRKHGVSEFTIPGKDILEPKKVKEYIGDSGITLSPKQGSLIPTYVAEMLRAMNKKAVTMYHQFGWTKGFRSFIVGDREVTGDGVFNIAPSKTTKPYVDLFTPAGTFEKWKEVFDLYGKPGMEPLAFAVGVAFGAPLMKLLEQEGSIINLMSQASGTGKTTALRACNSVYGNPKKLCAQKNDTPNAQIQRLGMMNNLPFTTDEITNLSGMTFSDMAYSITSGRGKDRMQQHVNELRANDTTWSTISLCSSNASFYDKMSAEKALPDGEFRRVIEYRIGFSHVLELEYAKEMFDHQLNSNYGHAGEKYLKFLVDNYEEVKRALHSYQNYLDRQLKLSQAERFWSAAIAAILLGIKLAKDLGLLDWDLDRLEVWVRTLINELRDVTPPSALDPLSALGEFINCNQQSILIVNGNADARTKLHAMPLREPKSKDLFIRYEPDTKLMYIALGPFKTYCVSRHLNFTEAKQELLKLGLLHKVLDKRTGEYVDNPRKQLNKGASGGMPTPAERCLVFDCTKNGFIDFHNMLQPDNSENGEDTATVIPLPIARGLTAAAEQAAVDASGAD
jgi:hypothetical protein